MTAAEPLRRGDLRAVADLFGAAFVDDPGWTAVGPRRERRRRNFARRVCGGEAWVAGRIGGTVLATRDGGVPTAAITWFEPGADQTSLRVTAAEAPGVTLAGPAVVRRALKAQATLAAGRPAEPHLFVSLLAVHPDHQRGGRGRVLLEAALARAEELDVLAHLNTANPDNLPYYRAFGFEITGETRLPRETPAWFLLRAPGRPRPAARTAP